MFQYKYIDKIILIFGVVLVVIANGMNHWWISSISLKMESGLDSMQRSNRYIDSLWRQHEKKEQIVIDLYTRHHIEGTVNMLKSFYSIDSLASSPQEALNELSLERSENIERINSLFESVVIAEKDVAKLRKKKEFVQSLSFLLSTLGLIIILIKGNP